MNTVEMILIVLLGAGFVILLILSIVLISVLLKITKNVKKITDRAEEATTNVADIAAMVGKRVAPVALSAAVAAAMRRLKRPTPSKGDDNGK